MYINSTVEFRLDDLNIPGFHSDYDYLIEGIETEIHKEVHHTKLVFFPEFLDEIAIVEKDVRKVIEKVGNIIEKEEKANIA